jgi:SSS family solute:Na+ symporter
VIWGALIIIPAILFSLGSGSILELLSKVGSYFVGAKLAIFLLGFFSRKTSESSLLIGVAASFVCVLMLSNFTDVSWPWYALFGGLTNLVVARVAAIFLTSATYDPQLCWRGGTASFVVPSGAKRLMAVLLLNLVFMAWISTLN